MSALHINLSSCPSLCQK